MKPSTLHVMHLVSRGIADAGMENGIINLTRHMRPEFRISLAILDSEETFTEKISRPGFSCHLVPKAPSGIDRGIPFRLASLLRRERVDILHSHNWGTLLYGVLAARFARVRVIHGEHGKNPGEIGERNRIKDFAKRLLGRSADIMLTVSDELRAEWIQRYSIPERRIISLANGVDSRLFAPATDADRRRRALGIPEDAYVVGSVGRLDALKNHAVVIQALARLRQSVPAPDIYFVLIGQGPLDAELRAVAQSLGVADRVRLLGVRKDIPDLLGAMDVFAFPSLSEGMSNVLLEAMSAGLPVVANDLSTHRQIVASEDEAVLLSPCNPETMAAALYRLWQRPQERLAIGAAARSRVVADFSLERMISRYEDVYCRVARWEIPRK